MEVLKRVLKNHLWIYKLHLKVLKFGWIALSIYITAHLDTYYIMKAFRL